MGKSIGAFLVCLAGASAGWSSLANLEPTSRRSTDPPLPPHGKLGQDLFLAIDHRDLAQIRSLLRDGADPNARNGLEFTPLYIATASHQMDAMRELLKAGANKDTRTTYGTPLSFAAMTGNVEGADLLLSLGVKTDVPRTDGMTPLILAANAGVTPIVTTLTAKGVDVNTQDDGGETALAEAARNGFLDPAQALVGAGANVNTIDAQGETPLMLAAKNGHADLVRLLLNHGAHPNSTDNQGCTALFLSASYGDYPDTIRALLEGGANAKVGNQRGDLPSVVASRRGFSETAALLAGTGSQADPVVTPRVAINRSLALIQSSTGLFSSSARCVSCHQEGLGRMTTGEAAAHGFHLDPDVQSVEAARVSGMVAAMLPLHKQALKDPQAMKQLPLIEINEVSTTDGWLLGGMISQKQPRTEATAAMAMCLARQQAPDGSWTFSVPRVPMQSSFFTFTALAVHALQVYAPESNRSEIEQRIARAREWLSTAHPQNSEDRASRLLGLTWAAADKQIRREAVADILKDQRRDGGWSQLANGQSDAYATGQALYALQVGGMSPSDPAWRRGERFLLRTQDEDGSWYVNKRAMPANNYFSSGFPHGESQYASFNGTCWATLALLQTFGK